VLHRIITYEIGALAVDGWAVTFGTARRGLGGAAAPAQALPRCTKCNSLPINDQCRPINNRIAV